MKTINLAGCIMLDDQQRILMLHRNTPKRTQWEIPGGKIEAGESAEAAAQREVREELGLEVIISREIGSRSFVEDDHTMGYTWFLADVSAGVPQVMEPDLYDELRYLSMADLRELRPELSANTVNFVTELEAGRVKLTA
mgnify:FL=1